MTAAVRDVVAAYEALSAAEQKQVVAEIVRRAKGDDLSKPQLADQDGRSATDSAGPASAEELAEFDRALDELAADLASLPADFSRADIYREHD